MKRIGVVVSLAALVSLAAPGAEELEEASDDTGGYVGVAAAITLPQGGSSMRRLGGGALRAGWYFDEFLALEGEVDWLENAAGYSRFDPFFTAGARGWIGGSAGQVGPSAGVGTFWHLTDEWSLRFDAAATLGLDTATEVVYSLSVGVQRSF